MSENIADKLALKGGGALWWLNITNRQSEDIDISISEDHNLDESEFTILENNIKRVFKVAGYKVINYKVLDKPKNRSNIPHFWGGYKVTFAIIAIERYNELLDEGKDNLGTYAIVLNEETQSKKIEIDMSLEEFIFNMEKDTVDGIKINIYTPLMIVYEKIRATCQQLPEYKLTGSSSSARARDLYDIYTLFTMSRKGIEYREDVLNPDNFYILEEMFRIKEVDLELMTRFQTLKPRLEKDYSDSVLPSIEVNDEVDFEFLFNYINDLFIELHQDLIKNKKRKEKSRFD